MNTDRRNSVRRGYTLLEMLVASVSATFLVVGLASAMFVAARGTDPTLSAHEAALQGDTAMTDLIADLTLAESFSEKTTTAVTFVVPDRNNDGIPETIRYAWSGTPGDPLTRQYNGGAVATVVANVHEFQFELPPPSPNLLTNPGAEDGTTAWQAIPDATMLIQTTPVYAGTQTLYAYRNTAQKESGVRQNVTAFVANGTTYEVGAWMRKWAAPQPYDVRIQLRIISTGGGEQIFSGNAFNIDNVAYKWVGATLTPTWTGTLTTAYWEATGISKIQEIYVDNAEMRTVGSNRQNLNIVLQVGSDSGARIESGVLLKNKPL
ncbi:MAG: carbohydrate binding domain-containing protein [Planctomycetaceae bacterium]